MLTQRPDLADEVEDLLRNHTKAPETRRAYASDWRVWTQWCTEHHVPALPASIETAAAFLVDMSRTKARLTVERYASSIGQAHKLAGHASPMASPQVKEVVHALKRKRGVLAPNAKSAFLAHDAPKALEDAHERDRALILFGFVTGMRRSEICAVKIEDLEWRREGIVVHIRRSKTDQHGVGRVAAAPRNDAHPEMCPVRAVEAWLRLVGTEKGPLFRGLYRGGQPRPTALTPRIVASIVKRCVVALGQDPSKFAGHSLRAGYVTQARLAGLNWGEIMEQTGHRKVETVKRYERVAPDPFKATKVGDVFKDAYDDAE